VTRSDRTAPPSHAALDALFGALADPTRRDLLHRLVSKGPASATVLAESFPLTRQAVVKHLHALESAGLVIAERFGREVLYRATPERLSDAVVWLLDSGARWDRRMARLAERHSPRGRNDRLA